MGVLSDLEPGRVFSWFERICAIPHGSGDTGQIADFLQDFAAGRHLDCVRDGADNVILRKPGTAGYENAPTVILQGHTDMVCEKEEGVSIDFHRDPLRLRVRDGVISAEGTTLGGDDGIAVAFCLAILDAADIPHPPLEVVLTTGEEIGMLGAAALDMTRLRGRRLINIDSEDEGILLVSCAGGATVRGILPVRREGIPVEGSSGKDTPAGGARLRLRVSGLAGGHSGVEIDKGRANANQVLGRALYRLSKTVSFRLISVSGGNKDNAIPRSAEAALVLRGHGGAQMREAAAEAVRELSGHLREEYRLTDPGIRLTLEADAPGGRSPDASCPPEPDAALPPMDADSTKRTITALRNLPGGIVRMSAALPGLVQTSLNLGILETDAETVSFSFSVRSSVDSEKTALMETIQCLMEALNGRTECGGIYPAWTYRENSPLRDLFVKVFTRRYGHAPKVEAIHAGVECGLFAGKLDNLDAVSFGPDIRNIHTPQESMEAESVRRTWEFLLEVLRELRE